MNKLQNRYTKEGPGQVRVCPVCNTKLSCWEELPLVECTKKELREAKFELEGKSESLILLRATVLK